MELHLPETAYHPQRIILHWLSAAVILWAIFTGFSAALMSAESPVKSAINAINPQVTTLFIPFFLWRAGLYFRSRPWSGWARGQWPQRAAVVVHALLYGTVIAVLATGYLMMPASWKLLGFIPMPEILFSQAQHARLFGLHRAACVALAVLVTVHLLAVLRHHRMGRPILNRMMMGRIS